MCLAGPHAGQLLRRRVRDAGRPRQLRQQPARQQLGEVHKPADFGLPVRRAVRLRRRRERHRQRPHVQLRRKLRERPAVARRRLLLRERWLHHRERRAHMVEQLGHTVQHRDQPGLLEREVDPDRARGRADDLRPREFEYAVRRGLRAVETHRPVCAVRLPEGERQHAQRERRGREGRRVGRLVRRELRHRYAGTLRSSGFATSSDRVAARRQRRQPAGAHRGARLRRLHCRDPVPHDTRRPAC